LVVLEWEREKVRGRKRGVEGEGAHTNILTQRRKPR
jgi:hypothetical protein